MATILENESAWSTTAATNANVDTGIGWAENQDPASVNNSARGMMAARAKARLDQGGERAAGGTADALTVTTNQGLTPATHLAAGLRLALRATAANTSTTVTLAVDGATPANIKRADGSVLAAGSITSDMMLDLVYNAGSSEWRAVNIPPLQPMASVISPVIGSARSAFAGRKTASAQGVGSTSSTQITFSSEDFDIGANFSTSIWLPPAGVVAITSRVNVLNSSGSNVQYTLAIYRAAVLISYITSPVIATAVAQSLEVSCIDQSDGISGYHIEILGSGQPYTISNATGASVFFGYMI